MSIAELAGGTRATFSEAYGKASSTVQSTRNWLVEGRRPVGLGLPLKTLEVGRGLPPIEYIDSSPEIRPGEGPPPVAVLISGLGNQYLDQAIHGLNDQGIRALWIADPNEGRPAPITDNPRIIDNRALPYALLIESIVQNEKIPGVHLIGHSNGGGIAVAVKEMLDPDRKRPEPSTNRLRSRFPRLAEIIAPTELPEAFYSLREAGDTDMSRVLSIVPINPPSVLRKEALTLLRTAQRAKSRPPGENNFGKQYLATHPVKGGQDLSGIHHMRIASRLAEYDANGIPNMTVLSRGDQLVPIDAVDPITPNIVYVDGDHSSFVSNPQQFGERVGGFINFVHSRGENTVYSPVATITQQF